VRYIDVAEWKVEMHGDHAEEGSEAKVVLVYEDILRACKSEAETMEICSWMSSVFGPWTTT
ncbi:hypothetical protein RUND412_011591, partial [Rhizina undulata]